MAKVIARFDNVQNIIIEKITVIQWNIVLLTDILPLLLTITTSVYIPDGYALFQCILHGIIGMLCCKLAFSTMPHIWSNFKTKFFVSCAVFLLYDVYVNRGVVIGTLKDVTSHMPTFVFLIKDFCYNIIGNSVTKSSHHEAFQETNEQQSPFVYLIKYVCYNSFVLIYLLAICILLRYLYYSTIPYQNVYSSSSFKYKKEITIITVFLLYLTSGIFIEGVIEWGIGWPPTFKGLVAFIAFILCSAVSIFLLGSFFFLLSLLDFIGKLLPDFKKKSKSC